MTISIHGLNILTGFAGQISVGHAAFMGVGAYACASFMTFFDVSFLVALPLAGLTAGDGRNAFRSALLATQGLLFGYGDHRGAIHYNLFLFSL